MQITLTHFRAGHKGYALIITMVFLAVMLLIFGSMMMWTSTNAKINQRNNQFNMSEAAAEAATERVLAPMERDFLSQSLVTNGNYYATNTVGETNFDGSSWPVRYNFSDANGTTNQISVIPGQVQSFLQPVGSEYSNLMGFNWYWTNIATATPVGQPYNVSATVTQVVNFSSIPIFQFAIFYNINLEIDPGASMTVNGAVWSNAGLWAGTANLTFNSTVSAVDTANISSTDPFATGKTDGSAPPNFNLTNPAQPTSKNTAIIMPIAGATNSNPTNVETILNIPPAAYAMGTAAAYTTNGLTYLANAADLVISNSALGTNYGSLTPYGTNITIYYQNAANTPYMQKLKPDFYIFKTGPPYPPTGKYTNYVSPNLSDTNRCYTNVYYAGWSFVTNVAFYDFRESDTVQAVQIDVSMFNIWVTNNVATNGGGQYNSDCIFDKTHSIDSIWVYNSVPINSTSLPAVRVVNGLQLPNSWGFTVATPMPIYVKGDYNVQQTNGGPSDAGMMGTTTHTFPAALMGDAVTILSSNWSDAYTSGTSLGSRTASATTVNAAMLEGIVPSSGANYSGGVENFLRFLETWGTTTYNGSIVVMFPSIYATNIWQAPGAYYTAPARNWGFDLNFLQQSKLPPLTPQLKKTVRVSWNAQ